MKFVIHTVYRHGSAGLSNLIMSVELGVVLASLSDRVLILKGNKTPTANVVQYDGLVRNTYPSRVTDLIDLGLPWIDADRINLSSLAPKEICDTAGVELRLLLRLRIYPGRPTIFGLSPATGTTISRSAKS